MMIVFKTKCQFHSKIVMSRSTRTTDVQLSKITKKSKILTDTEHFYSCNHQKWLSFQIRGGTVKNNVEIAEKIL